MMAMRRRIEGLTPAQIKALTKGTIAIYTYEDN